VTLNRTTISAGAGDDEAKKGRIEDYLESLKVVIDDVTFVQTRSTQPRSAMRF